MWVTIQNLQSISEPEIETLPENDRLFDHDSMTGLCPAGHGIMIRAKVDIDEPFYLDKCTSCGGIWFDRGEWLRIVENNLAENLCNIWSKAWQRKHSKEKNRAFFLNMNHKLLGDNIFNMIIQLSNMLKKHPEKNRAIALLQHEITR